MVNRTSSSARPGAVRKRILIVNAFFDEYRRQRGSPFRIPQAMGPHYLAGAFAPDLCDVRIHNEQALGPLKDAGLLGWPDMLVLTGLNTAFDRMRQLTAYARTLNPRVIVVAGGSAVRALPIRSREIFDYACPGDIEELQTVVHEALGLAYVSEEMFPRFDLLRGPGPVSYVESSRYCNFKCSFCSLTGEGHGYRKYDLHYVRRQILAAPRKQIVFIDNNFYGNDRRYFLARIEMLRELYRDGRIKGWSALVTEDFFKRPDNLMLARDSGCQLLFSGVESLDEATLRSYNKRQNLRIPQTDTIRNCLDAGINFAYGIMLDPATRTLDSLRREIRFIVDTPEISLPGYFTLSIPMLGTDYFRKCLDDELLLPNLRLSHCDGVTLNLRPLDPIEDVIRFARDLTRLRGYRMRALWHTARFVARHRSVLNPLQLMSAAVSGALICTESLASSGRPEFRRGKRTFYAPTETLDPLYTPHMPVDSKYEPYFQPTRITNDFGAIADDVAEDILGAPSGPGAIGRIA